MEMCEHESDGLVLGQSWMVLYTYKQCPCCEVSFCCLHINHIVYKHLNPWCTLGHQSLGLCEGSDICLLGCSRNMMGVCCCLQTCHSILKTWRFYLVEGWSYLPAFAEVTSHCNVL